MDSAEVIKEHILQVIGGHFGQPTAVLYREVYAAMPLEMVLKSSHELLAEYVGETKAKQIFNDLGIKQP